MDQEAYDPTDEELWAAAVETMLIKFAKEHPKFTAEDAWAYVTAQLGQPKEPNIKGYLFRMALVESNYVARFSHTKAKTKASKGREVTIWKSTLCPDEDEIQPLQKTLATLHSKVNKRELSIMQALIKAYEMGATADHES